MFNPDAPRPATGGEKTIHYGVQERSRKSGSPWQRIEEHDVREDAERSVKDLAEIKPLAKHWEFRLVKITTEVCE